MTVHRRSGAVCFVSVFAACVAPSTDWSQADIESIHCAMREGRLTARQLVDDCVRRIRADQASAQSLHAILRLVPYSEHAADRADAYLMQTGTLLGPLHGIPVVVKDNIDVAGVPTSLGLRALAAALPPADAEVVARIRAAGGIILGKTNLATLARSSRDTVSEVLGRTSNPYGRDFTISGSSGGTAAAVAAGFATIGLGTDTGASIRGPCAHACLVGIRPTFASAPLRGIAPLYVTRDTVGPIARTVADAARLLGVLRNEPCLATPAMDLHGIRLGVVSQLADAANTDPEVARLFQAALDELGNLGATLVVQSDLFDAESQEPIAVDRDRFPHDLDAFLRTRLPPHDGFTAAMLMPPQQPRGATSPDHYDPAEAAARTEHLRTRVSEALRDHRLTALVYPTWSRAPLPLNAGRVANGDNSGSLAPPLGLPALTVPMGFTPGGLPAGIEFAGRPDSEATLISIAEAYERRTMHRHSPPPPN
jgi:amidase